jgi:peroxiredoxin
MKRIFSLLLVFLCVFNAIAQEEAEGLPVDATAPDFTAKDINGKEISLSGLKERGAVVIIFYRGNWCPYCNKELKTLQDSLQFITDKGATVVAISPEAAEGVNKTITKTGATFPVLHDADVRIAKAYNVSYEVDEKTRATYLEKWNVDFLKINEQKGKAILPVPAVYIVNKEGKITYRFFDRDISKRPSVQELVDHLN